MNTDEVVDKILEELARAEEKHPTWPTDLIHAGAIVAEESGELTRATLNHVYENDSGQNMLDEAVQVGAMAIRFLKNLAIRCCDCKHLRFDAFTGAVHRCAARKATVYGQPSPLIIFNPRKPRFCSEFEEEQPATQEKSRG